MDLAGPYRETQLTHRTHTYSGRTTLGGRVVVRSRARKLNAQSTESNRACLLCRTASVGTVQREEEGRRAFQGARPQIGLALLNEDKKTNYIVLPETTATKPPITANNTNNT